MIIWNDYDHINFLHENFELRSQKLPHKRSMDWNKVSIASLGQQKASETAWLIWAGICHLSPLSSLISEIFLLQILERCSSKMNHNLHVDDSMSLCKQGRDSGTQNRNYARHAGYLTRKKPACEGVESKSSSALQISCTSGHSCKETCWIPENRGPRDSSVQCHTSTDCDTFQAECCHFRMGYSGREKVSWFRKWKQMYCTTGPKTTICKHQVISCADVRLRDERWSQSAKCIWTLRSILTLKYDWSCRQSQVTQCIRYIRSILTIQMRLHHDHPSRLSHLIKCVWHIRSILTVKIHIYHDMWRRHSLDTTVAGPRRPAIMACQV